MKTKEITLCGKPVMVSYCFATELAFKKFTGANVDDFDPTNPEHIFYIILSAIASYYQSTHEEAPVKDEDLMYEAKSKEMIDALNEVLKLRADWYQLPKGDTIDEPEKTKGERKFRKPKNA
jgi:hypothetical protein